MPILSPLQRRSPGGRLLVWVMYVLLVIGSIWMVYPFLLMLSGSVKSEVDKGQLDIVPRYLYDDAALFRKYEEQRYAPTCDNFEAATRYRDAQGRPVFSLEFLPPPPPVNLPRLADWDEFLNRARSLPRQYMWPGHGSFPRQPGEWVLPYRRQLAKDLPKMSRLDLAVSPPVEVWVSRKFIYITGPFAPTYENFRKNLPSRYFIPTSVEGDFVNVTIRSKYGVTKEGVARLNEKWGTSYTTIFDVTMSPTPPLQAGQRAEWWEYVRETLSTYFIRFDPSLLPAFQKFLQAKHKDVAVVNQAFGTSYASWKDVQFPPADVPGAFTDLQGFLQSLNTPDGISIDSMDFRWRDFLREKYGNDLVAMNAAYGTSYASFDEVLMPQLDDDWRTMMANRGAIIRELFCRNYVIVWDALASHGRAIRNTFIFCLLSVVTALIVNPLAAYALSRFQPRWGYAALFVLMATMAFPGEVTQIPAFLMLREMGLLNTFAALIIPGVASGYSIFLLKGFFDSLPRDLYESATIDGASELRIFLTITIPLSGPILAVVALGAFTSAYGAFQFALLVCQEESMWTIMVHIFELQQIYNTPIVFASLVIAAVPTLLVFVFCQNIIMRGIVVPVEK